MAPPDKARASGVSASSFLDLKVELAKQESEFAKNKGGQSKYVVGGTKRADKKPTVWARKNKGVASRAARDLEEEAVARPTIEAARAALERKAQIYEKLRKGKSGGLSEQQYEALLVDFDSKALSDHYESDSDDVDESLAVPKPHDDDPIVEYQDEFGRMRTARRSEVPRNLLEQTTGDGDPNQDDDPFVIYNPVNHFPVYEPSAERVASIQAAVEAEEPIESHYDATKEVRAKGAAYYRFSGDEESRLRAMEELKAARAETEHKRQEMGAVDVKSGDVEGMVISEEPDGNENGNADLVKSRGIKKRKRELEERRKLLEAKRRKSKDLPSQSAKSINPQADSRKSDGVSKTPDSPVRILAPSDPSTSVLPPPTPESGDPFAILESTMQPGKRKVEAMHPVRQQGLSAADDFLMSLERDMLSGGRRK